MMNAESGSTAFVDKNHQYHRVGARSGNTP